MPDREIKYARILMVDDNPTDILLMRRALLRTGVVREVCTAADGQAATDLLRSELELSPSHRPDLIVLDLNMPRKDGFLVLKELKEDISLQKIPVVVYSSSTYPEDIRRSYALHANSYIPKPISYEELEAIATAICRYWFGTVRLPQ